MDPKYPDVEVQLSGEDGNIFFILGRCRRALKAAGYRDAADALSSAVQQCKSYDAALRTVAEYVNVS